jgi:hypothetical protein
MSERIAHIQKGFKSLVGKVRHGALVALLAASARAEESALNPQGARFYRGQH